MPNKFIIFLCLSFIDWFLIIKIYKQKFNKHLKRNKYFGYSIM
jgi:hypothetical protein